jgi:hypothetical protein
MIKKLRWWFKELLHPAVINCYILVGPGSKFNSRIRFLGCTIVSMDGVETAKDLITNNQFQDCIVGTTQDMVFYEDKNNYHKA